VDRRQPENFRCFVVEKSPSRKFQYLHHRWCKNRKLRERLWLLKNSFRGVSTTKFVRELLNVRSPKTLEFAEITALVPFSTATPVYNN
jgi:hypothetical protein